MAEIVANEQNPTQEAIKKAYQVGANYTVDNSKYAAGTDANSVALNAYDNTLNAYKAALQASYDNQAEQSALQAQRLKQQYDANRSNIYTNARLSAIGNNERMAALGLAGNLYDHARSGTSETSRINQDVNMRRSLAEANLGEANAQSDLSLALLQAQKEADQKYAEYAAQIETSKIPYLTALSQAASIGRSGGGGSSYGSTKKSSSSSSSGVNTKTADTGSGGSLQSVHNAIVANKNNGYTTARNAALQELAKINSNERAAAAEHAEKLLSQLMYKGTNTNANR